MKDRKIEDNWDWGLGGKGREGGGGAVKGIFNVL